MCGITGVVSNGTIADSGVMRMNSALRHRGPDGYGTKVLNNVELGHRRLSIIDLGTGVQPMANEDESVWVTFNGEIYNYVELRKELLNLGHEFRTSSDTEIIVHAYEEWGERCVKFFRGMFAFAVYDQKTRRLFLARDRLGIKPLFYCVEPGRFAFASELQGLEKLPGFEFQLNQAAIGYFLQLRYIPGPDTIYRNVFKLPPGHSITIESDAKVRGPTRYWDVAFEPDEDRSIADWVDELDATIREATRLHLRSDVPFGTFLSGGVDSSLVVAYMSEFLDEPVRTFTIGFDEQSHSEIEYAREVAVQFQTDHHEDVLTPDALEILPELVRHYGEPFGDSSAIPTYYVSRLARQHVKMVLSGDGGDEAFGGYSQHAQAFRIAPPGRRSQFSRLRRLVGNIGRFAGLLPDRIAADELWLRLSTFMDSSARGSLFLPGCESMIHDEWTPKRLNHGNGMPYCSMAQYMDMKYYLPYTILTKVDIASMCHGLEVRVPLLDHHVIELAARIPAELTYRRTDSGYVDGKQMLKRVAERRFNRKFLDRPKRGFAVPLVQWLSRYPKHELRDRLLDPGGRLTELFEKSQLEMKAVRPLSTKKDASELWLLLFLSEWFRQHPNVSIA